MLPPTPVNGWYYKYYMIFNNKNNKAFTLLELLIVIGVLATLATVVILVLNPAELLKQSRDAKRLSEIKVIDDAIRLYTFNSNTLYYGTSSVVYLSLPSSNSNCSSYTGLPSLSSGWTYACKPESDYRKVDGTGWIPVNFSSTQAGPSLAILPVDPINNSSYYYAYIPGSWSLTTKIESIKFIPTAQNDGGYDLNRFELGSNLALWNTSGGGATTSTPWARPTNGLVSWYKMDNNWLDSNGTNHGTGYNGVTFGTARYGAAAGSFDGVDDYVFLGKPASLNLSAGSIEAWVYNTNDGQYVIFSSADGTVGGLYGLFALYRNTAGKFAALIFKEGDPNYKYAVSTNNIFSLNNWHHVVFTVDSTGNKIYVDGSLQAVTYSAGDSSQTQFLGYIHAKIVDYEIGRENLTGYYNHFNGLIDEVVVYNRALTPAEITDIYNNTK